MVILVISLVFSNFDNYRIFFIFSISFFVFQFFNIKANKISFLFKNKSTNNNTTEPTIYKVSQPMTTNITIGINEIPTGNSDDIPHDHTITPKNVNTTTPATTTTTTPSPTTNADTDTQLTVEQIKPLYDNSYDRQNMNEIFSKKEQFYGIMKKYWNQRHNIFEKYDDGILLTKELWFSVTPEIISKFTARIIHHCFKNKNGKVFVMDAFSGGGGNVNQFLKYFDMVFAVDINKIHLYCTVNNAKIYFNANDVNNKLKLLPLNWTYADQELPDDYIDKIFEDKIEKHELIADDHIYANKKESLESLEILKSVKFDCIFGSPPWGGPEYFKEKYFNLNNILPYKLEKMLKVLLQYTDNIILFLPKNSNLIQVQKITEAIFHDEKYVRVLRTSLHGRPKGLLCCWGPAFVDIDLEEIRMEDV